MLKVENLTKIYWLGEVEVRALGGVSFEIEDGEMVAIMGPSGSGKSTLMNLLGSLDQPTTGSYQIDGEEVADMTDREMASLRNRKLGFVFQNFNLLPRLTALANVELPMLYSKRYKQADREERAYLALEAVGLGDRIYHKPKELSGGQQQRVAIARALVNDPGIILADEPTGALDSHSTAEVLEIFQQLNQEDGLTIIFVTHEPDVADRCHRTIRIRDGLIESDHTTSGSNQAAQVLLR